MRNWRRLAAAGEPFARFRCSGCGAERLVALSCKGRGFCPSCLGRRMVASAAHLVDRVLPLRTRAPDGAGAQTGSVTVVQRFGSALNLNVHFHTLALDGVFTEPEGGGLRFHTARAPTETQIVALLETVRKRIGRLLVRRGLASPETGTSDGDVDADLPPLADLYAASVQQRLSTGERAGRRPLRLRSAASVPSRPPRTSRNGARLDGFDLHASPAVRSKNRDRLERLCRYLLRPPIANDRLSESDGLVLLALPRPWSDGSTHLAFTPTELVERLAALVPRPHVNLILYHGVLAAHARLRPRVVRFRRPRTSPATHARVAPAPPPPATRAGPTSCGAVSTWTSWPAPAAAVA